VEVQNFLLNLVNSAIGAFLGFLFAMYLQRNTEMRSQKNKINLIIKSLQEELFDITTVLQQYIQLKEPLTYKIQTPSWDAILGSGIILELIECPIYAHAIKTYSLIKHFNENLLLNEENNFEGLQSIIDSSSLIIK
jgi:hypothetical protein